MPEYLHSKYEHINELDLLLSVATERSQRILNDIRSFVKSDDPKIISMLSEYNRLVERMFDERDAVRDTLVEYEFKQAFFHILLTTLTNDRVATDGVGLLTDVTEAASAIVHKHFS